MFPTYTYYAKIHLIKDNRYCECGFIHNYHGEPKKRDLKKIEFKSIDEVTCRACRDHFFRKKREDG